MASLKLVSPPLPRKLYRNDPLPTMELSRYDALQYTEQYLVTELKVLFYGETTVYKGTFQDPDTLEPIPVVIKTDFYAKATRPSAFQREADVYELKLPELQSVSIPRCFGLFQHTAKDDRISSFLFLEYSGEAVLSASDLTPVFKGKALATLHSIHDAGYIHGDLSLENITDSDGEPFFIDLDDAQPHTCELEEKIFVGEERWYVPCEEMSRCAGLLHAWAPDVRFLPDFTFSRSEVRWENIDSLMAQLKLFDYDTEELRPDVEELIKKIESRREFYRNMPPKERLIHPHKADALTPETSQ